MKLFSLRKRTARHARPAHRVEDVSPEDQRIARHWGYTDPQWTELPAIVKVDKREGFFAAMGLS